MRVRISPRLPGRGPDQAAGAAGHSARCQPRHRSGCRTPTPAAPPVDQLAVRWRIEITRSVGSAAWCAPPALPPGTVSVVSRCAAAPLRRPGGSPPNASRSKPSRRGVRDSAGRFQHMTGPVGFDAPPRSGQGRLACGSTRRRDAPGWRRAGDRDTVSPPVLAGVEAVQA